jgi:nitroreductase
MPDDIGLFEAIYSQRAIRYFKPDPVPEELIHKLIEAGTKAPSGGNRQGWKFLVITDPETKEKIGAYYEQGWEHAYGSATPSPGQLQPHVQRSAEHLARTMGEAPVLLMACIEHDGGPSAMGRGGSIFPSVQNILLAARGMGLGSCLTSLHKRYENEIKDLLGIPENVETAALLPIGFPAENNRYGPTRRQPVEDVTYRERWGEGW